MIFFSSIRGICQPLHTTALEGRYWVVSTSLFQPSSFNTRFELDVSIRSRRHSHKYTIPRSVVAAGPLEPSSASVSSFQPLLQTGTKHLASLPTPASANKRIRLKYLGHQIPASKRWAEISIDAKDS